MPAPANPQWTARANYIQKSPYKSLSSYGILQAMSELTQQIERLLGRVEKTMVRL